ncbi:APC family permease [Spongisporangium articulatum]|uniref:APC family permease n=1 Tax=Spongisporangium articulatum TaxID=3362603 RepID=A0ABW8AR45_9ACTN
MTTTRAAALTVGALLGPSLLVVPGLAAAVAGPASLLGWSALLALSGLLAWVFAVLGSRVRATGGSGVADYAAAGLGPRGGRAVGWAFLVGVVLGAPFVSLAGGSYVAAATGGGRDTALLAAGGLLLTAAGLTSAGARQSSAVQLVLVAVLLVVIVVAVVGSAPRLSLENWTPFAPHGTGSIARSSVVLMLSFVGWEVSASVAAQLRDPRRLPRVLGLAFAVTTVLYLGLAVSVVGVLGPRGGATALSGLLDVAVGRAGPVVAAVAAVVLTLAGINAYLSAAAELASRAWASAPRTVVQLAVLVAGAALLTLVGAGQLSLADVAGVPVALFLTVYLGCTASAVQQLEGPVRVAAAVAFAASLVVLVASGWAALGALLVVVVALVRPAPAGVGPSLPA